MATQLRRMAHIMRDVKTTRVPSNFMFVDCETKGVKDPDIERATRQYFWFGSAIAYRLEGDKRTREKTRSLDSIKSFYDFLEERIDKSRPLYVFAHNATFDLTVLDFWRWSEEVNLDIQYAVLEDPPFIIHAKWKDCSIYFLDTFNYWKESLARLGESIGMQKLEMPKSKEFNRDWYEYCVRDTEIIAMVIERLVKYIRDNDLGVFAFTQASQSLAAFRHRFMKTNIYIHENDKVLKLERDSYHGGLVHCFYIGEVSGQTLYQLDVNSLYPSMMLRDLPHKMIGYTKKPSPARVRKILQSFGAVAKVHIECDRGTYPYYAANKLLEVRGKFTTVLCGDELIRAIYSGDAYHIEELAWYEMAPIFREYVNYFWTERMRFRSEGDKVGDTFAKILMNSLYGKFAQRSYEWVEINPRNMIHLYDLYGYHCPKEYLHPGFEPTIHWQQNKWFPLGITDGVKIRCISGMVQMKLPRGEHTESLPIVSSYVTSYARERLRNLAAIAGWHQVYYCDTDSLFTTRLGYQRLVKADEVDVSELGKLKIESLATEMKIYCPKDYVFNDKVVMKGIRKNAIPVGDREFTQEQFEGIRSILRRNPEPFVRVKWINKKLSRKYTKGIVGNNGWVDFITILER